MKGHCAGVLGGSDELAAVVVRAEAQELVVDLVQRPGSTSPSTLPSFAQSGRGGKVSLAGLPSPDLDVVNFCSGFDFRKVQGLTSIALRFEALRFTRQSAVGIEVYVKWRCLSWP